MNESFLKADVFFFVTTIAVIIFTIGGAIALWYFLKVMKRINSISDYVEHEIMETIHDVKLARRAIREEGSKLKNIVDFALNFFQRPASKPRKKKVAVKSEN